MLEYKYGQEVIVIKQLPFSQKRAAPWHMGATKEVPEKVRIKTCKGKIPDTTSVVVSVGMNRQGGSEQAYDWPVESFRWALDEVC